MKIKDAKKSIKLVFPLLWLILTASPAWAGISPVIYFVPHQDDGTLSMGADMSRQNLLDNQIIIVLVTNGNASMVRDMMCAQKNICLTKKQYTAARNKEMAAAVKRLAPTALIRRENYQDGALTAAQASTVVKKYMKRYPDASFKTMSWITRHNDHRALALALKNECSKKNRQSKSRCSFFLKRDYWVSHPLLGEFIAGYPSEHAAADEFALWNPSIGRYAIGQQSVPQAFTDLRNDPRNKFHLADCGSSHLNCLDGK